MCECMCVCVHQEKYNHLHKNKPTTVMQYCMYPSGSAAKFKVDLPTHTHDKRLHKNIYENGNIIIGTKTD